MFATFALFLFLVSSMLLPSASAASPVTTLCSSIPNYSSGDFPTALYPATGGAFVETGFGNLVFCGGGNSNLIASSPYGTAPWDGMGGVKTKTDGIVLALTNYATPGLWICYGATSAGCSSTSGFINLPASFCSSEPKGYCDPQGTALDKSLNLYYVDYDNAKLVECTASSGYQSCSNLAASSALAGHSPIGLFLQGTTFYITDYSCTGTIWKGTKSSLSVIYTTGEEIGSIAVSTNNPSKSLHVYVGMTGFCKGTSAFIKDLTDGKKLASPFTAPESLYIDSKLQFDSSYFSAVYQTKDLS